ncbi:hypothetical protein [Leptospira santarosai]|uniref:hypothetical protein n=1 Tax=Leptospira santarosai TaxID=28183 RepID=UPI00062D971D|nr:hypothetical protein [Leptospira santarosai]AVV79449.1 Putative lipoprotein [Leptospira santarosai]ONF83569.1 hypothetical protein BWD13_18355 [Leptospira santarosai serovar Grippotyphosa]
MGKEIILIVLSLLIGLSSCEKETEAVKKDLTNSKKITLEEYKKLSEKERISVFNELEMSNRFELLKTILVNNSGCSIGPGSAMIRFKSDGKLYIDLHENSFLNRWKIDSKGLTIYNVNQLESLEDYLGKKQTTYNVVYWVISGGYSLNLESDKPVEEEALYSSLSCDP